MHGGPPPLPPSREKAATANGARAVGASMAQPRDGNHPDGQALGV